MRWALEALACVVGLFNHEVGFGGFGLRWALEALACVVGLFNS